MSDVYESLQSGLIISVNKKKLSKIVYYHVAVETELWVYYCDILNRAIIFIFESLYRFYIERASILNCVLHSLLQKQQCLFAQKSGSELSSDKGFSSKMFVLCR